MRWPPPGEASSGTLQQAIVEQARDAIIFIDREGVIRLWNRGAEIIFGYAAEEAVGRNLNFIIPEKFRRAHHEGFRHAIDAALMRNDGRILTTRAQDRYGGRVYVDFSFGLLKDTSGAAIGAFAIGRDCTARHMEEIAKAALAESQYKSAASTTQGAG